jgi:aspartate 1-decarboxylase
MWIQYCKSKIAFAKVTQADLHYEGSITIDKNLMDAVGIIPSEKVEVLNLNNGNRFETYTIAGKAGAGKICLNGPAARLGVVGDKVIILSYATMEPQEAKKYKMQKIQLDDNNKIKNKG